MKRTLTLFLTALILFSAAACGGQTVSPASREDEKKSEKKVAFTARDLDGNLVDQSVLSGKKVTMLNFTNTGVMTKLRHPVSRALKNYLEERQTQRSVQVVVVLHIG